MAKYQVTGPDGKTYEITAPDNASEEDILSYAKQNFAQSQQTPTASITRQSIEQQLGANQINQQGATLPGLRRGMMDPIEGAAQFMTHLLPEGVVQAGNQFNNWLVDKGVPLDRIPAGGIDQQLAEQEQQYQQERAAQGRRGFDAQRLAGNVLSPINFVAPQIAATTIPGKMAAGAITGALMSQTAPVTDTTEKPYWEQKRDQATMGAAVGGAVPLVGAAISRALKPNHADDVALLTKEGVTPAIGQVKGGAFKTLEEKARSIPITGDAITARHKVALEQFNKAIYNRILEPLGEKLPKNIKVGHAAFNHVDDKLSDAYEALLPKLSAQLDRTLTKELQTIKTSSAWLPESQQKQLSSIIDEQIIGRFDENGMTTGETFKKIESKLGTKIRDYITSSDPDKREMGLALRDTQDALRRMLVRQNPEDAGKLTKINKAYAIFKRAETAMSFRTKQDEEIFSPANYDAAVQRLGGKKAYAGGKAFQQDISTAGKRVLAQSYPDSGTAGRLALGGLTGLAGLQFSPGALIGLGAGAIPYLPGISPAATKLMLGAPGFIDRVTPPLTAGLAQYAGGQYAKP